MSNYIDPFTLEERLMHVAQAEVQLGSRIPWLADAMTNELKHALGDMPNPEFIIDPDGRVVGRRAWSNPTALRQDLERLVGPVENPTRVSDLGLVTAPAVADRRQGNRAASRAARPDVHALDRAEAGGNRLSVLYEAAAPT